MVGSPSRRPYHSPRRQAAARETRAAVLDAARREFTAHGYESTSLAAIARSAGVSLATVKLVEPTKARLLVAAIEAVVRAEDSSVALVEQSWWTDLLAEPDPERLLAELADRIAVALERQVDLLAVVWQATPRAPEVGRLEERASLGRWSDLRSVVDALDARAALRAGLTTDDVTDALWAIASPQTYALLVRRRGWTRERWAAWLRDTLVRLLLPGGADEGRSGPS